MERKAIESEAGNQCRIEKVEKGVGIIYMKKVFEIPVYALTREQLRHKFVKFVDSWKEKNPYASSENLRRCIEIETYPQRLWEYNHIVGYIVISTDRYDILFDLYLPTPLIERYIWTSKQKRFLYNIQANGTHFHMNDKLSNMEIQKKIQEMLNGVIKRHIPERFFVDLETFKTLNRMIDYKLILQEELSNGQVEI